MDIKNSELIDIDFIFEMYKVATEYQKQRVIDIWPEFDKEMVKNEIIEKRQFKLIIKNQIVCVWVVTFDDPYIWGEKNNSKSIYIHRLATHKDHRGNNFALKVVEWAKEYALKNNKKYIRLDTVGHNKKLIKHYTNCGFKFLGLTQLSVSENLPDHYQNASVSLFEIEIKS
jgi:GNAT superfamily N-acetyltransferase